MVNANSAHNNIINKLSKPVSTSKMNSITNAALLSTAAGAVVLSDLDNNTYVKEENNNTNNNEKKDDIESEINLWEFSRLYTIADIPIIDFIIIYIIIYLLNKICMNLNYKFILVLAIPITIIFELFTNKNTNVSNILLIIFVISIILLLSTNVTNTL